MILSPEQEEKNFFWRSLPANEPSYEGKFGSCTKSAAQKCYSIEFLLVNTKQSYYHKKSGHYSLWWIEISAKSFLGASAQSLVCNQIAGFDWRRNFATGCTFLPLAQGWGNFLARKSVCEAAALRSNQFATKCNRWVMQVAMSTWPSSMGSQSPRWSRGSGNGVPGNFWHMTSRLRSCNVTKTVRGNLSSFRQLQLSDAAHTCTTVCKLDHTDCFLSCWNCLTMFTKR